MRRWLLAAIASASALGGLAACAAQEKAAPAPAAPAPAAKPAWQEEWERTLAAAKQEGRVAIGGALGEDLRRALTEPFTKKYGIQVDYQGFSGPEFPARLRPERAAGQYLWDLYVGGSTTPLTSLKVDIKALDSIRPQLILPEVTDPKGWREGKLPFQDKDGTVMALSYYTTGSWYVSPRLVDPKEFKSWKDLLDPKWKGKVLSHDARIGGTAQSRFLFFYLHPQLGPDFIRALGPQLVISRDYGQMHEWIATARYPILISAHESVIEEMIEKGAPIARLDPRQLKEGGYHASGIGNVALINKAPHPNAAKVYINWLLSKEGQLEFSKATGFSSTRRDVPQDHVPAYRRPVEGYFSTDAEEAVRLRTTKVRELAQEIIGR